MLMKVTNLSIWLWLSFLLFLDKSSCNSENVNEKTKELLIKAITSFELRTEKFDEIPNLFYVYENLVYKRFDSIKDEDGNFADFRKIHQFYALNTTRENKFLDVIVKELVSVKSLEIFKTNKTWEDEDVLKFGFLRKEKEGNLKFADSDLAEFFIAQYILDHIFKPIDSPSNDEMEIRLRFLMHLCFGDNKSAPMADEFIMAMVKDLEAPMFSDLVRVLMEHNFKYLLDGGYSSVDKISTMFSKDKMILSNLWGIDQNQPFFLRFCKITSDASRIQEMHQIAAKYFNVHENQTIQSEKINAPNIFKGKNQVVNILHLIYEKNNENFTQNILEATQLNVSANILQKLQQKIDFLDFVDTGSFEKIEKQEFYLANGYNIIKNQESRKQLKEFWNRLQKYFNPNQLKIFLTETDHRSELTHLYYLPCHTNESYVKSFIDFSQRYLGEDEIRVFLTQKQPITGDTFIVHFLNNVKDVKIFEMCWNFTREYLYHEELKDLLFGNGEYNFIEKAVVNPEIFTYCMEILPEFYTPSEIRRMILKSKAVILTVLSNLQNTKPRTDVTDYLKKVFNGHDNELKELEGMVV